mgnify:FL=1
MKRVLFCIFVMSLWVSKAQEKWVLDSKKSLIKYEASHFLHDWAGSNENVKGVLLENEGVFQKIALAMYLRDFDSKNSNRDNNALEILEVLKFPKIEFYSDQIEKNNDKVNFSGSMIFHGIELEKKIISQVTSKKNNFLLEGNFKLTLSDFEVPLPSFMLRKMEDEILIKYELYFEKLK